MAQGKEPKGGFSTGVWQSEEAAINSSRGCSGSSWEQESKEIYLKWKLRLKSWRLCVLLLVDKTDWKRRDKNLRFWENHTQKNYQARLRKTLTFWNLKWSIDPQTSVAGSQLRNAVLRRNIPQISEKDNGVEKLHGGKSQELQKTRLMSSSQGMGYRP